MPKNSLRSGIVIVLLLGTLALAVPYVSSTVDAWLFADGDQPAAKWNTQRPAGDRTPRPANPDLLPPGKQLAHEEPAAENSAPPLAFEYSEAMPLNPDDVRPVEHQESASTDGANGLTQLQEEIQALGAVYVTVEKDGERFECRTLFPLAPHSSYQKAFSAVGSTPQAAMEQVLAEVRNWQRASQRR